MMDEDAKREIALLQSQRDLKSSSKVTQAQIDKLKELHNKRLRLKQKSNYVSKTKKKERTSAVGSEEAASEDKVDVGGNPVPEANNLCAASSLDNTAHGMVDKKKRKLHWGLDEKKRWERKANM